MAYELNASGSAGRPRRAADEPIYVDSNGRMTSYVEPYVTDPKDDGESFDDRRRQEGRREERGSFERQREDSTSGESKYTPQRASVSSMSTSSDATSQATSLGGINSVSPELLAEIKEEIKREIFEHLKQTGTIDPTPPPPKTAEPLVRENSNKTSSTPSPPPTAQKVYTPPSPPSNIRRRRSTVSGSPPPLSPSKSSPQSSKDSKPGVRFMNRGQPDGTSTKRPAGSTRSYSTAELSTIDQKWGMLFDHEKNPTPRLGQFLRGLANHIIEDFEPKKNIVITPEKMTQFYTKFRLDKEEHPYLTIFQSLADSNISQLYQDIGCAHHLVALDPNNRPTIPGLTPYGFAHWMTLFIMAYPDLESQRLEKIVLALPINADGPFIDNKPERLPKQISRHLLPGSEDRYARLTLSESISDFLDETGLSERRKVNIIQTPQSQRQSTSAPPVPNMGGMPPPKSKPIDIPTSKPIERERMPYVNTPSVGESAILDDVPVAAGGIKIERERQPYTAQPGSGKVYNNESRAGATTTINSSTGRRERGNSIYHNSTSSARDAEIDPVKKRETFRDPAREVGRDRERDRERERRQSRTNSSASRESYLPPPRPAGARRQPSPPIKTHSQSTPGNLNLNLGSGSANLAQSANIDAATSERYAPSSFGTGTSQVFTPSTYSSSGTGGLPTVFPISVDPRDSHPMRERERSDTRSDGRGELRERELREREREMRERERAERMTAQPLPMDSRDRDREIDARYPAAGRERRMTNEDPRPDISSPREAERWDRLQEGMEEDFYRGVGGRR